MSATLVFGSAEANEVRDANRRLDEEVETANRLQEEPVRRWLVSVEVLREEQYYIMARTPEDALDICERKHDGRPQSAILAKRQ